MSVCEWQLDAVGLVTLVTINFNITVKKHHIDKQPNWACRTGLGMQVHSCICSLLVPWPDALMQQPYSLFSRISFAILQTKSYFMYYRREGQSNGRVNEHGGLSDGDKSVYKKRLVSVRQPSIDMDAFDHLSVLQLSLFTTRHDQGQLRSIRSHLQAKSYFNDFMYYRREGQSNMSNGRVHGHGGLHDPETIGYSSLHSFCDRAVSDCLRVGQPSIDLDTQSWRIGRRSAICSDGARNLDNRQWPDCLSEHSTSTLSRASSDVHSSLLACWLDWPSLEARESVDVLCSGRLGCADWIAAIWIQLLPSNHPSPAFVGFQFNKLKRYRDIWDIWDIEMVFWDSQSDQLAPKRRRFFFWTVRWSCGFLFNCKAVIIVIQTLMTSFQFDARPISLTGASRASVPAAVMVCFKRRFGPDKARLLTGTMNIGNFVWYS